MRLSRVSVITSPSAQGLILGSAGHGSGMGFGTVLVRCWDQTWSLGRTGLSLSDPGLEWWKHVHLSSPSQAPLSLKPSLPSLPLVDLAPAMPAIRGRSFRYHLVSDTSPSFPSLRQAWLLPCLLQGEGSVSYHLIAVGSLPVLSRPQDLMIPKNIYNSLTLAYG